MFINYDHYYRDYKIELGTHDALEYYNNKNFRDEINQLKIKFKTTLHLNLTNSDIVINAYALNNVDYLYLPGCKNLTDVCGLRTQKELNLGYCSGIVDVGMLGNIHTLNLSFTNIVDVSNLNNVYSLALNGCKKLINVTNLNRTHILNLSDCPNIKNLTNLDHVNTLIINNCKKIKDVGNLINVEILSFLDCKHIKDIGNLRNLKKLTINSHVNGIQFLKKLKFLIIYSFLKIKKPCLINKDPRISSIKNQIKKLKRTNYYVVVSMPCSSIFIK